MFLHRITTVALGSLVLSGCSLMSSSEPTQQPVFRLESPAFADLSTIPAAYTCDGEGKSPPLTIRDVPQGTVSLALVMDDLNAPAGHFVHWVVWDIGPEVADIAESSAPTGAMEGTTSAKSVGYAALCPPTGSGPHRYVFTLYAINDSISLSYEATRAMLEQQMKGKVIAIAKLTGIYERAEEIEN